MQFIKFFEEVGINDIGLVGGKNASLGEMIQHLSSRGITIPSGFAITSNAYRLHLSENNLIEQLQKLLDQIDTNNLVAFAEIGKQIRDLIKQAPLPRAIEEEVRTAYAKMEERYSSNVSLAVRSSATAEDLPNASFAGQQETYLNIIGVDQLIASCPRAFASLFTDRAMSYRIHHGFVHMEVALSIGVQKMVRSDKASSGVVFTLDTESGHKDVIFITSSYGLGEAIVQGAVNPDEFYVHKQTLKQGFKPLLKKRLGSKKIKMIYSDSQDEPIKTIDVTREDQQRYSLTDQEILELARQSATIEDYFSEHRGQWSPMDIEWAKDGLDGKLYIVQARPETIHSLQQDNLVFEEFSLDAQSGKKMILQGKSIGRKIVSGVVRVIESTKKMHTLHSGEILVTDMTDPDWEPIMKKAGGIITNRGGRTCHAAIVSRELGIPAIVGAQGATESLVDGQVITMDCSDGEVGTIYEGALEFNRNEINVSKLKKPPVDIMVNVGNPDQALSAAQLPSSGVGLARLEFIINNALKIHPMALVQPEKVTSNDDRLLIDELTTEYNDKKEYFIDKLAQEAGTIAAAFYPRPVIIRMSDFKSNEYRRLIGGEAFEPEEENPMLGFRGASRYYHERYQAAFALECAAIKKIRNEMGLVNALPMIPFVRTIDEAQKVINEMQKNGLAQGENGLEIYMMCEIPSNVILIEDFAEIFDGFSIGSNDLTQMILGVDRDSALVAPLFNELDEAVKRMLKMAIEGAHKKGKKIGICGQGPSDYPEMCDFLIACGIDSISLSADTVLKQIIALDK